MWESGSNLSEKGQGTAGRTMAELWTRFCELSCEAEWKGEKWNSHLSIQLLPSPFLPFPPFSSSPLPSLFPKLSLDAHAFASSLHQELSTEILLAGEECSQW